MTDVLVCIKRVPIPGARIVLTDDEQSVNTRNLGFAVSPHEECAVEEAIRLTKTHGGMSTVLTLGTDDAIEQLRAALSMGMGRAILLESDGREWGTIATARAIVTAIRAQQDEGFDFDVILLGNESADTSGYQVGIRVAHALDVPCVSGIKSLEINGDTAIAKREVDGSWELFEVQLPAVFTIKEGINVPRYPTLPGRIKAKKQPVHRYKPEWYEGGLEKVKLMNPLEQSHTVEILGEGPETAPKIVELFKELGIVEV